MSKKYFIIIFMLIVSYLYGENTYIKEYLEMGDRYFSRKQYSQAINSYNEVLSIEPDNEEASFKMARLYTELKAYDAAQAFLEKIEKKSQKSEIVYKYLGEMYYKRYIDEKKDVDKIKYKTEFYKNYEKYITTNGYNDSEAIYFLGNSYFKDRLFETANSIFINEKGRNYKNYFGAAVTYRFLGYYPDAIKYYKKVIEIQPDFNEAYMGLGISYQLSNDFINSIHYFEKYLEKENDENVYHIVAKMHMTRNNIQEAKKSAEKGLRHFPNSVDLKEIMIDIYAKM